MSAVEGITLPEGFVWEQPDTWPVEFKQIYELAAQLSYLGLMKQDKRMLDVQITGALEPVTMLFAVGDRAEELRRAWLSVYAIHNPSDRADSATAPDGASQKPASPSPGAYEDEQKKETE